MCLFESVLNEDLKYTIIFDKNWRISEISAKLSSRKGSFYESKPNRLRLFLVIK